MNRQVPAARLGPGHDARAAQSSAQFLLCGQLERHLRQLLQSHRFFDPPVRDARLQLRNAYVSVLLGDLGLSQVSTLEALFEAYAC